MNRIRISTTVDGDLLTRARTARNDVKDADLIDEALEALLARDRTSEIDASYAAYDTTPLSTEDEWGNPEAFLDAMRRDASRPR